MAAQTFLRTALLAVVLAAPSAFAASAVETAQAQLAANDLNSALKTLDKHLAGSPQDAEARFTRGLVLVRMNRTDDALKVFSDLTRDYPQLPEPYNNLAVLYAQRGDYEKARDALEAALATHPAYATAHENLGDIYAALAGAAYNRALMLDKDNGTLKGKVGLLGQLDTGLGNGNAPVATTPVAATASTSPVLLPEPKAPVSLPPMPVAIDTPAAAAPMATPKAQAAAAGLPKAANDALMGWAKAWAAKDVDGYLAYYAPSFVPDGGLDRGAWEAQRRERISRPRSIRVQLSGLELLSNDGGVLKVRFSQNYRSDNYSDRVIKLVDLVEIDGAYRIARESVQ